MFSVEYVSLNTSEDNYTRIRRPGGAGGYLLLRFLKPMYVFQDAGIAEAAPGSMILFAPGTPQDYSAIREFAVDMVRFYADGPEAEALGIPVDTVFMPAEKKNTGRYLEQLEKEFCTRDLKNGVMLDAYLRQLFIHLKREEKVQSLETEKERVLYRLFLQARYTMLKNCEQEWASTNVCEMVSLSRSQFYKYYTDFFGVSPMQDLTVARIEKAKQLLTNKDLQVTEVAYRCGYNSIHHFSRTFKEHCGMSPVAYVKSVAAEAEED